MGILSRFSSIVSSNINAQLDKMEDPSKMIDQYLREATKDLASVRNETAGVMAEEARCRRERDKNVEDVAKYGNLARAALKEGNEGDARKFLEKKQELETIGAGLETAYAVAHENATKMRQMHDKLVADINDLNARRNLIKSKVAVAKTQEMVNKLGAKESKDISGAVSRLEQKVDNMLDRADARAELSATPVDEAVELEKKYKGIESSASVEDELAKLKEEMGI
ncbi:MAG: PspA/IM30 family protein [Clostridiales bacterium]|nr:PspA/IM30 family protein [Clostridiales bacterium]